MTTCARCGDHHDGPDLARWWCARCFARLHSDSVEDIGRDYCINMSRAAVRAATAQSERVDYWRTKAHEALARAAIIERFLTMPAPIHWSRRPVTINPDRALTIEWVATCPHCERVLTITTRPDEPARVGAERVRDALDALASDTAGCLRCGARVWAACVCAEIEDARRGDLAGIAGLASLANVSGDAQDATEAGDRL